MHRAAFLRILVPLLVVPGTASVCAAQAPRFATPPAAVSYAITTLTPPFMPDSAAYGQSYWLEGGAVLGGALAALGAIAGWQLCSDADNAEPSCTDNAVVGFAFGAVLGFPVGALIGAQIHKHPAAGPPPN
jgi:hypothetical protein